MKIKLRKALLFFGKIYLKTWFGIRPKKKHERKHNEFEDVTLPETNIAHEDPHLSW